MGGPAAAPARNHLGYLKDFIERCGEHADFVSYHPYGERVDKIVRDITYFNDLFHAVTGTTGPRVMITESDHRIEPDEKFTYLMERQLALLDLQDAVIGFHHFSLPYFAEGGRLFGLIDTDGGIVPENYWPYWAFNDIRGERLRVESDGGLLRGDLSVTAAASPSGEVHSVVVAGTGRARRTADLAVTALPADGRVRIATVYEVSAAGARLVRTDRIDGNAATYETTLTVPGSGAAVQQDAHDGS